MKTYRLGPDDLIVPMSVHDDETGEVADGFVRIKRGHPEFTAWEAFAEEPSPEELGWLRELP